MPRHQVLIIELVHLLKSFRFSTVCAGSQMTDKGGIVSLLDDAVRLDLLTSSIAAQRSVDERSV